MHNSSNSIIAPSPDVMLFSRFACIWGLGDASTASLDPHCGNILGVVLEQVLSSENIGADEARAGIAGGVI